jgi:hypothetical protein
MTDTNQKLREALRELIEAYNRAGPELSRAERAVDRMRLIAAHEALALPTAAPVGDLPELLEALQHYLSQDEIAEGYGGGVGGSAREQARAAIAKATGATHEQ